MSSSYVNLPRFRSNGNTSKSSTTCTRTEESKTTSVKTESQQPKHGEEVVIEELLLVEEDEECRSRVSSPPPPTSTSTPPEVQERAPPSRSLASPNRWQQMYTTQDWWTMWIGILSFALAVTMTFLVPFERGGSSRVKYVVPQPMKWTHNPLKAWDLYNFVGTILMLAIFLNFYLLSLSAMGKLKVQPQPQPPSGTGANSNTNTNPSKNYREGFVGLCVVATIAFWIGSQRFFLRNGFGYAIWSIIFGMIIGNSPLSEGEHRLTNLKLVAKDGEYFIKCSLVLLAVEFSILGELGLPAIGVAWGASPITLVSCFMIGRRIFKMDIIPALLIVSGATWCGASAISAIAAVVSAPNQDTVACIGVVATGTVIFTFAQPYFALLLGMDHYVAGAWIGGSVDQTGNVIASAAIISDEATEVAGIVKIILNSGLGILATFVAIWWQWQPRAPPGGENGDDSNDNTNDNNDKKNSGFSWLFLWDKFPKFVLGYLLCSGILTIITKKGTPEGDALQASVHSMSKWWFSIAFVGLGVSTNLKELYNNAKSTGIIKLYLVSNIIDMSLSFLFAWLLFSKY